MDVFMNEDAVVYTVTIVCAQTKILQTLCACE